jgi:hypothetical protein
VPSLNSNGSAGSPHGDGQAADEGVRDLGRFQGVENSSQLVEQGHPNTLQHLHALERELARFVDAMVSAQGKKPGWNRSVRSLAAATLGSAGNPKMRSTERSSAL